MGLHKLTTKIIAAAILRHVSNETAVEIVLDIRDSCKNLGVVQNSLYNTLGDLLRELGVK